MPTFTSEGYEIAFSIYGEGPTVLLVHGFASNGKVNWVDTGWVDALVEAGYRVVTIDNRGHGKSEKIYDTGAYPSSEMAKDSINLIDYLGVKQVAIMGYSMGARISAYVSMTAPDKIACAVFGGLGERMTVGMSNSTTIVDALLAPTLEAVTDRTGRTFRIFAEHTKSDLKALAACMGSSRQKISEQDVAKIDVPVLVAVGSEDEVGGRPEPLAALMDRGESLVIEGRDHMRATGDKQFKEGVLDFFKRVYPAG
ncbi:alpha/beta fold hydrolase [Maritalea sp. S77]|uniref:alpha/beta fold hydrolase n=1 Tax=Maritalea sp. S77 TaxID=3415125 RepID=UPI003C7CA743